MIDGTDHRVEIDGPVEEVPRDVALECSQEHVDAHDVRATRPHDLGEELVTREREAAKGEVPVSGRIRGRRVDGFGDAHCQVSCR